MSSSDQSEKHSSTSVNQASGSDTSNGGKDDVVKRFEKLFSFEDVADHVQSSDRLDDNDLDHDRLSNNQTLKEKIEDAAKQNDNMQITKNSVSGENSIDKNLVSGEKSIDLRGKHKLKFIKAKLGDMRYVAQAGDNASFSDVTSKGVSTTEKKIE